jgi:CBS domain-containing protein
MEARQLLSDNGAPVITIRLGDPVREAVQKLAANSIGAVMAIDANGKLAGILSERDIVRGLGRFESGFLDESVDELLTKSVISCEPGDNVFELVWLMDTNGIRHLPVVEDGALIGIISIRDAMKAMLKTTDSDARYLRARIPA